MAPREQALSFVVNGKTLRLTRAVVEGAAQDAEPEPIQSHAVVVAGKQFPVKQIFSLATGLDRLDFNSSIARRQLLRLGFEVLRVSEED
jgi:hypothetical protein